MVVGGGVAGLSCAYHLAHARTPVLLIERTALAAGSSGRSAAFIETQYIEADRVRMCVYGLQLYRELAKAFPLHFQKRGKVLLGRGDGDRAHFEASVQLQHDLGFSASTILESEQLVDRFPQLRIAEEEFALYGPDDGYLDPGALCNAYATAATEQGATIKLSTELAAITASNDGYVVHTDREAFACTAVVIAAGAWAEQVGRHLDLNLRISGYRRQVALLRAPTIIDSPLLVDPANPAGCLYFRDDGRGRLLAGLHTEEHNGHVADDPDRYPRTADSQFVRDVGHLATARLRDSPPLTPIGGWAGLYPISADGRFLLGESRRRPGVFVCAGLAGNGIQLSAAAGAIIAQLVTTQSQTILPSLDPYAPDRFLND